MKRIAIIGAGAAGCFCAVELKRRMPQCSVDIFEAGPVPLAKVAITGGGRCNLTNSFEGIRSLGEAYPRGARIMKGALRQFGHSEVCEWFESNGVRLVTQEDNCVFPASQDAMQVVDLLTSMMKERSIRLHCKQKITDLRALLKDFDAVVVTSGGNTSYLASGLGIAVESCVPSLFTFNIADKGLRALMGTVKDEVTLSIPGTKFRTEGILLITDWGMSGPAVLKLSSYAARYLAERQYRCPLSVRWSNALVKEESRKLVRNTPPAGVTARLWKYLVDRSSMREDICWSEVGSKGFNKLNETLINDSYEIVGRCHFKEEFVTCGGVSLDAVDCSTLESKDYPGVYFAGETLDIDAITGGFNLQAAWTTGWIVAKSISQKD